jgi:hypothetical protein
MPRRKKKVKEQTVRTNTLSKFVTKEEVRKGDLCYFVSCWNDIQWGEVIKVLENEPEDCIFVQDQTEFKFFVVPCRLAAWEKVTLKKMKWDIKANQKKSIDYFDHVKTKSFDNEEEVSEKSDEEKKLIKTTAKKKKSADVKKKNTVKKRRPRKSKASVSK